MVWLTKDEVGATNFGINFVRVLVIIGVLGIVASSILYMINSPKNAVKLLIGFAVMLIICGIAYAVSPGEVTEKFSDFGVKTPQQSKLVDMGLYLTAVLGFGAVALTLITEGISLFKN